MKKPHTRHSQAYKDKALALAAGIGVSKAATQLGLHASQLYGRISKQQHILSSGDHEQSLAEENALLKRLPNPPVINPPVHTGETTTKANRPCAEHAHDYVGCGGCNRRAG
jgi:transposase